MFIVLKIMNLAGCFICKSETLERHVLSPQKLFAIFLAEMKARRRAENG